MSTHRQPSIACTTHRRYGLSCADFDALIERTGNCCELCATRAEDTSHGKLHIDHDPMRGQSAVRGLLCGRCNTSLDVTCWGEREMAYLAQPLFQRSANDSRIQDRYTRALRELARHKTRSVERREALAMADALRTGVSPKAVAWCSRRAVATVLRVAEQYQVDLGPRIDSAA